MRKLAVFDLDGTLHHTELALAPAIASAVSDITGNPEPSFQLINSLYGEPLEVFCRVLVGREDRDVYEKFVDRLMYHQAKTLPELGGLYPGVKDMLVQLQKKGFDLAILSNAHNGYIDMVTETLGIRHLFLKLVGRTEEASKTERLSMLINGYDFTVMIGDRYHDIQAAMENSIPAIACLYGYGTSDDLGSVPSVKSPKEIVQLVENLLTG